MDGSQKDEKQILKRKEIENTASKSVLLRQNSSVQSLNWKESKEKNKEWRESKNLDDLPSDEKQSNSGLEEYLETASTELKNTNGKRRTYSRQSSTASERRTYSRQSSTVSESRYSRTVSKQSAVIE